MLEKIDPKNRRKYFRINDSLPLRYTLIEKVGDKTKFDRIKDESNFNRILLMPEEKKYEDSLTGTDEVDSSIINLFSDIDRKLNLVINLLIRGDELIKLIKQKPIVVNINASGMRFACEENFAKGNILKLEMVIPTSPFSIIEFLSEVVWISKSRKISTPKTVYNIGVKFIEIDETCRDEIISYILKRQRNLLRNDKKI